MKHFQRQSSWSIISRSKTLTMQKLNWLWFFSECFESADTSSSLFLILFLLSYSRWKLLFCFSCICIQKICTIYFVYNISLFFCILGSPKFRFCCVNKWFVLLFALCAIGILYFDQVFWIILDVHFIPTENKLMVCTK